VLAGGKAIVTRLTDLRQNAAMRTADGWQKAGILAAQIGPQRSNGSRRAGLKICEERRWFVQEIVGDAVELPAR
jgi:hypothetical protein